MACVQSLCLSILMCKWQREKYDCLEMIKHGLLID